MPTYAAPDAGSVLQQIEQNKRNIPSGRDESKTRAKPMVGTTESGAVTVLVQRFDIQGNTLLPSEQLDAAVAPWLQQNLDFKQLQQVALVVASVYRDAGWLVRVSLPQQDVIDGVVVLRVVEASFGETRLQGTQNRVDPKWLQDFVTNAQASGQPISSQRIDKVLLLLDDVPGLTVSGNLIEGGESGRTDLLLIAEDRAALNGSLVADNAGSRSTGAERVVANLSINSPLHLGDQLALTALKTQGSSYQRMGYTLPLGFDGLRAGTHTTHLSYNLVGDFASLNSSGTADSVGFDLSYPLLRSQDTNVRLSANYDAKSFDNNANGASASRYSLGVWNFGINANQSDDWAGGGANSANLSLSSGSVNLDGSANQTTDANGPASAGHFAKLNFSVNRQQTLTADLSAYVAVNVQRANKNLDSSERLYLGGVNGVRAYPSSEGGGSDGEVFTFELRQQLDPKTTLTGFFDRGQARAFKNNAMANGSGQLNSGYSPNTYALQGYGVSLAWKPEDSTEMRATLARRIGTSPIANTGTGADGDGTHKVNRLWLNATYSF